VTQAGQLSGKLFRGFWHKLGNSYITIECSEVITRTYARSFCVSNANRVVASPAHISPLRTPIAKHIPVLLLSHFRVCLEDGYIDRDVFWRELVGKDYGLQLVIWGKNSPLYALVNLPGLKAENT
jgi:hypothetical protein